MGFKKFTARYIFTDEIALESRIFNLMLVFGIFAEIIAIAIRIIERVSLSAILAVAVMIAVTVGAFLLCNKFKVYKAGIWVTLFTVCDILFPLLFFTNGGAASGLAGYFVLCIIFIFSLLRGIECALMVILHCIIIIGCYLAGKWYPQLVIPFESDVMRYVDIIHTILIAGILAGFLIKFQTRIYQIEKEKAEATSRSMANFLASISHEIRTPLNAVIGLGELELNKELPADTVANLEKMHSAGRSLLSIINDLLDISKIEAGRFELVPVEYQTPGFINETASLNMVRIGSKPITFKLDVDPDLPSKLFGDELRIRQILNNFLSNAFKYTDEGTVTLRLRGEPYTGEAAAPDGAHEAAAEQPDRIWLNCLVEDTGRGIRAEDMGKLFSQYQQVDQKNNRHIEGTGLGLAICKNMVALMGGTISVQSEYGKGSSFSVRIPQVIADHAPIGPKGAEALGQFWFSLKKRERRKGVRNPLPYGKVLVVDDVSTNLDVAAGMMRSYGLTIDCVKSAKEAIQLISGQTNRYDAVFMDHMMPEMDGFEALKIIRGLPGCGEESLPVIALTANAIAGNDKIFLQSGFQDFISKPIDITKLDAVLNRWVRNCEKENSPEWAEIIKQMKNRAGERRAAAADATASTGAPAPANTPANIGGALPISGIDFAAGIKSMGNDKAAYERVLASYCADMPAMLEKIRAFDAQKLDEYVIAVHGIKGVSYAVCANEAGKQAEALETAAKQGDVETIRAKNDGFISQLEKLAADIGAFLTPL